MPLIIISGFPTAGKTYRASQLADYFTQRIKSSEKSTTKPTRVHHITDESLSIRHDVYNLESHASHERSNNSSEKDARALVYAAVKRVLSNRDVVILDAAAGNYIKGWRYQLYCEAKAVRTPCCVVHVGTPIEQCRRINEERLQSAATGTVSHEEPYEMETWENLVFRYEEPNAFTRWDSPLFTVVWDDEHPPNADIWTAMMGSEDGVRPEVRPNAATVAKRSEGEGYLQVLDKITQEIVSRVAQWGSDHEGEGGGEVKVDDGNGGTATVALPSNQVPLPVLQRLRRQYIQLNRASSVDVSRIRESFVQFLNGSFESF